jgi:hypothetical protein
VDEQLLRMRLRVEHVVGVERVQYALQARAVWPVEEELLPEALGEPQVLIIFLFCSSSVFTPMLWWPWWVDETHLEQRLVKAYDFGLEGIWSRDLCERRGLHGVEAAVMACRELIAASSVGDAWWVATPRNF